MLRSRLVAGIRPSVAARTLLPAFILLLSACGGSSHDEEIITGSAGTGMFVDHPVDGLEYETATFAGLTNRQGEFSFRYQERIRFHIGDVVLGSNDVAAKQYMTPLDLAPGAGNSSDNRVTNILRLLQTIDTDCDVTDGIQISAAARAAGAGRTGLAAVRFDQSETAFGSDSAVLNFVNAAKGACSSLKSAAEARNNFQSTLDHMANNSGRPNRLPTANAGTDRSVNEQTLVTLGGSGTDDDGSVVAYAWTQTSGPAVTLTGAGTASPSFTAPSVSQDTVLVFRLRVTDDDGATDNDSINVTVRDSSTVNLPPDANAGIDQQLSEGSTVTLNGSASSDPEDGANVSFQWTQTAGPAVTLSSATTSQPTFTAPQVTAQATLTFQLTVRDSQNATDTDSVNVIVDNLPEGNLPPVADAGLDQNVLEGTTVNLSGTGSSDPDGSIAAYSWTQISGPAATLTGASTATPSFTAPFVNANSTLLFRLQVTDNGGAVDTDDVSVNVVNSASAAFTVVDAQVQEGNSGSTTQLVFTVRLSALLSTAVTVDFATADGSATAPADYVPASGTLTFAANSSQQTVSVTVNGDSFDEANETVRLLLSNPTGGAAIADNEGQGTIVDDDEQNLLKVGAAKRVISPDRGEIAGQTESYLGGSRTQFFHLGGYGFGPFKVLPSYGGTPEIVLGTDPAAFSEPPAKAPCFARALTQGDSSYNPGDCEDNIWVRVLVLEQPEDGTRVAFVTIDAIGAGNLIQEGLKAAVRQASCEVGSCIDEDNILFGQTHSHAGPDLQGLWGGVPRSWINNVLYAQAAAAMREALAQARPAHLVMARGYTHDFNGYRRPKIRGDEQTDPTLTVLQARTDEGNGSRVLGTIVQYAAHPTTIGDGDYRLPNGQVVRVPHPDYPLGTENEIEAAFGGTTLYYNGPIADASPDGSTTGSHTGGTVYDAVKNRGENLAHAAEQFLDDNAVPLNPALSVRKVQVTLPVTNPLFLVVAGSGSFAGYYQFTQLSKGLIPGLDQLNGVFGPLDQAIAGLPQVAPIAQTIVSRISIGTAVAGDPDKNRLEVVTIPGETTNTFGKYIRGLAQEDPASVVKPKRHTMLLGLTHNSFGYIIPEEEFNYIDPTGEAGFVLPYTGYEEFVSLGPLTAPLLRIEGYNMLFDAAPEQYLPQWLTACLLDTSNPQCILTTIEAHLNQLLQMLGIITGPVDDVLDVIAAGCHEIGGPLEPLCAVTDSLAGLLDGGVPVPSTSDALLATEAVKAVVQGCDMLDTAHCLFPFPSDHFTVPAASGSPQSVAKGGTGRRVNFNLLAMPRNIVNKPIDPTEWNRNDGFSPGSVILTYVPDIGTVKDGSGKPTGPITGAVPLTDLDRYKDANAPVIVLDASTGERQPVWAEIDLNAGKLLPTGDTPTLTPKRPSLMIRPAVNFKEGHRYVVVLRNLRDNAGAAIPAGAAFKTCRDHLSTLLLPLAGRCDELENTVFPVLADAGIARNNSLYLAWDFTVASAKNNTSRLVKMRDDAFRNVLGDQEDSQGNITRYGRAPAFTVTEVKETGIDSRLARVVKGTFTIPSYVLPADPSPLDGQTEVRNELKALAAQAPAELNAVLDQCGSVDPTGLVCDFLDPNSGVDLATSVNLPPNRLFYNPLDGINPSDPVGSLYGDGLPDRNPTGQMTATFTCNIPKSAVEHPGTARPSVYGHGLLGSQNEGGIGGGGGPVTQMGGEHNMVFCATDWFGFATGDVPNVLTVLLDLSGFPVVPDASQQGMLNFMFLARLLVHPDGFARDPAFQAGGQPVFDRREVYYDGNSQGGILGGPVIAVSKDINRGVLGVPGMNYSTLLQRSVDFDTYAIPLYLAYPDDLDRDLGFALIQMLWDRSENEGYAQHLTHDALGGPDNQVLLHPAFADHQVSPWTAQVLARTLGVDLADVYPRKPSECAGDVTHCFNNKDEFFEQRDPDVVPLYGLPLVGRTDGGEYDDPACPLLGGCRTTKSAFVEIDEGKTATPPIGNVPPRGDGFDPHSFPRATRYGNCQKSHFLHTQGRVIDVRDTRNVTSADNCPALPAAVGEPLPGAIGPGPVGFDICDPVTGQYCLSQVPGVGPLLLGLLQGGSETIDQVPADVVASVVRTACDYQWLPGICDAFANGDPGYRATVDPNPDEPYFQTIGVVHNHSGYSDGDPASKPSDYFNAARTGHNVADDGHSDTGIKIDFMISSEHSENEKLPATTAQVCADPVLTGAGITDPTKLLTALSCSHLTDPDHYYKWRAELQQASEASDVSIVNGQPVYTGFTGMRGFEWTNDYYNHMNVYFSTNVVNAKIDGSYVTMEALWNWLRKPVAQGGGADGLLTFNHPGGGPNLTPFDGSGDGLPHHELLQQLKGGANWNDVAYVPDMDGHVVGMEVNGGDDIEWFVKALTKGWHLGPVAAEDEHQREWSTSADGKTVMLVRGRSPRDYYWAMKNHRTMALQQVLVNGAPGTPAQYPVIHYYADGSSFQNGVPLGSVITDAGGAHTLHVEGSGLPSGSRLALISRSGGQAAPIPLATVGGNGSFNVSQTVTAPASGQDWWFVVICPAGTTACGSDQNYIGVTAPIWIGPDATSAPVTADYGTGLLGLLAALGTPLNDVISNILDGDFEGAAEALQLAVTDLFENILGLPGSAGSIGTLLGINGEPLEAVEQALSANRDVQPVVIMGAQLTAWTQRAAAGLPKPYPSGTPDGSTGGDNPASPVTGPLGADSVRSAHNGDFLYPPAWKPGDLPVNAGGVPVSEIAAYAYRNGQWVEIPVQVDEKYPYFLANANSDFAIYSGTDMELTYAWDSESWAKTDGICESQYDSDGSLNGTSNQGLPGATPDPVAGLDDDDEVVFMARDAGGPAPGGTHPPGVSDGQEIALADPLNPASLRYVYLYRKPGGTSFTAQSGYIRYERNANADQWIDRSFFADGDSEKIGSSNTGYGANLSGTVCDHPSLPQNARTSNDRFPRDGVVVSTDTYRWEATGRWMVRDIRITAPGTTRAYGPDLVDRWKGRAFQQSPDSTVSLVGFEDEQVNWEANGSLLGERCGPVRCMREIWGADSGTNTTKTETFYRDAVTYRYHLRVHPIPPDGLYTSWDYNRGVAARYYTVLRPQGVPIDGVNDDIGNINSAAGLPAFFDIPDPGFNLPLAFDNWEQVSGFGNAGSLVYTFEIKGGTSFLNPTVVPYYRDDACMDDGTGDDPVPRPWPGEATTDARVKAGYAALAGKPYNQLTCADKQGAYGAHGLHFFVTHDTDNGFVLGVPLTEVDGQQWQFMVPTDGPHNVAEPYANTVRIPLVAVITPRGGPGIIGLLSGFLGNLQNAVLAALGGDAGGLADRIAAALSGLTDELTALVAGSGEDSVNNALGDLAENPANITESLQELAQNVGQIIGLPGHIFSGGNILKAGVGVVDMTPDVGYCAGQYCDTTDTIDGLAGGNFDPYFTHKTKKSSYGVQSRLTARAIVLEGANGKRIALLKTDNYLAQDMLLRRVGQILAEHGSEIGYEDILYHVAHNHSAAYSSTLSAGVWLFEDAFDARFFENQARKMAEAVLRAEIGLKPARLGATTVRHTIYKGNVVRLAVADDGTPAGYPLEYGDHGLVVMRIDDVSAATPKPLAVWVNWGEHPESLDGYDLHSADFLAPLERWVEREVGAPLVFSQGDVGSAENTGNSSQMLSDTGDVCGQWPENAAAPTTDTCNPGEGVVRDWNHKGYVQTERNVRYLADAIVQGWQQIGSGTAQVPFSTSLTVDHVNAWVPGPLSHPYPSVSNCRTETTVDGNTGLPVLGLPDCERLDAPGDNPVNSQLAELYNALKVEGVPVPDHYDFPGFGAIEENLRLKLQAFRIGDILLASCACEAQADLILNLESRTDQVAGNIYDGFDWACLVPSLADDPQYAAACAVQQQYYNPAEFPTAVPGSTGNANLIAHMRAQVHNDARGWDAPENVLAAISEPVNTASIWGNFTRQEIQALGVPGYKLAVGIGHAGDYNGYTVSYREYMNRDSYRKALTSYGPHTADYMVTRLVRMAAQLQGGPTLQPEPQDALAQVDELRQVGIAAALGLATSRAFDAYHALVPSDPQPAAALVQPSAIQRFQAATFRWRGGSAAVDNPIARVERQVSGVWQRYADMSGEVQTRVFWPQGVPGVVENGVGQFNWEWAANFEAYDSFPTRLGQTPAGSYRFVVDGTSKQKGALKPYHLESQPFTVSSWGGIAVDNISRTVSSVKFRVSKISYPRSYQSVFSFVQDNNSPRICDQCTFRPWAQEGEFARAEVTVTPLIGLPRVVTASCTLRTDGGRDCTASAIGLTEGAVIRAFDSFGETSGPVTVH